MNESHEQIRLYVERLAGLEPTRDIVDAYQRSGRDEAIWTIRVNHVIPLPDAKTVLERWESRGLLPPST